MILYFLDFYVLPPLCFLCLIQLTVPSEQDQKSKKLRPYVPLLGVVAFFVYWCTIALYLPLANIRLLPDYFVGSLPSLAIVLASSKSLLSNIHSKKPIAIATILVLAISVFLPYIAGTIGYYGLIHLASTFADPEQKVMFLSSASLNVTGNCGVEIIQGRVRANQDFMKFLVSGAGACGETSMLEKDCFTKTGLEAQEVGFPGEDHAFIEVKINGSWKVVDPGYTNMILVSRDNRADARVREAGTISYVVAYAANGFTELTQQYVSTDTVNIKITQNGEPLVGASVTLVHTLVTDSNSRTAELPGHGFSFLTDSNGTVTIHLGRIGESVYTEDFANTNPYYVVYVNGNPTKQKVTSTGTGMVREISIDLAK